MIFLRLTYFTCQYHSCITCLTNNMRGERVVLQCQIRGCYDLINEVKGKINNNRVNNKVCSAKKEVMMVQMIPFCDKNISIANFLEAAI